MIATIEKLLGLQRDPRTKDWLVVQSPATFILTLVSYVYIVKVWGPNYMRDRKPYQIKGIIRVYNFLQVIANAYFAVRIFYLTFVLQSYSPFCQGVSYKTDEVNMELFRTFHQYFFVRIADFLDTFFFVLTKKFDHISFLHVFHHTMVMWNGWLWLHFAAEGQPMFGLIMNMCVHVIMYTYYFLATLGPQVKKYLWWKKYLTSIQIGQFIIGIMHGVIPLFVDCGYPGTLVYLGLPQGLFLLYLFVRFYIDNYQQQAKKDFSETKQYCFAQPSMSTSHDINNNFSKAMDAKKVF